MTVTTTVAAAVSYAQRADADKRYDDAAASWQEAADNLTATGGAETTAGQTLVTTYLANKAASIANSHKAGAI
jgi:hypothetical protein